PGALPLDLRARRLDELAIGYAGRADRLAGAAAETEVEMLHRRVGEADAAFGEGLDQEDAPPRRVHLRPQLGERRAIGQAQTAMHAAVDALDALSVKRQRSGRRGRSGRGEAV